MTGVGRVEPGELAGWEAVTLTSPSGELEATFLPGLGMVGASLRHRGEELLAQRGGAAAYAERGSTFGIPLLHPWANRLSSWDYECCAHHVLLDPASPVTHRDGDTGLPIHGVLAASHYWSVIDTGGDEASAWLRSGLDFGAHPELLAAFPFPHRLELTVALAGPSLIVAVTLTPTSSDPVPVSFGFHPYLTLPGSGRSSWQIELPVRRRAVLDERGIPTGEHDPVAPGSLDGPLAARTFDDSFDQLGEPAVFAVSDERRRVAVEFRRGYPVAQVYAPEGSQFICFEPMSAPVNALRSGHGLVMTEPGGNFQAEFAVTVTGPRTHA